ncbi:MAG: hypothetical protein MRERC_1c087 [Mycoplasmataceae bacterium RC_NB112A]|nr:MAG: hypothetical protein MRERC_1c087 [Mycoplasmataceae bacterium RC_NB112A]
MDQAKYLFPNSFSRNFFHCWYHLFSDSFSALLCDICRQAQPQQKGRNLPWYFIR